MSEPTQPPTVDHLESWAREFTADLLSWAIHKVSSRDTAEDLVQDTFLVAADRMADFRGDSSPRTWLFGILKNKIAEHYRVKARQAGIQSMPGSELEAYFSPAHQWRGEAVPRAWDQDDALHLLDDPDFLAVFDGCLEELPEDWLACVRLKYLDGRPAREICQDVGLSTTNYWQIIHRAKLRLRGCIESHWFRETGEEGRSA